MNNHITYMQECIALGKTANTSKHFPVGALIVKDNQVIGKGLGHVLSPKDTVLSAEIKAVQDALKNTKSKTLKGCTLYTTHEPAIKCSYAIRHCNFDALVYGSNSHTNQLSSNIKTMLTKKVAKWKNPLKIVSGVLEKQCNELLKKAV
ncbi:nucleoside deaminase [Flavobacteriaceae bacterium R38]|nr:nucleoside deaminase [Flavobacteriaceae bacterium R38]